MVDSKENYKFDQGVKGLNLVHAAIFLSWWRLYLISSIVFFFSQQTAQTILRFCPQQVWFAIISE